MKLFTFQFLGVAMLMVNAFAAPLSEERQGQTNEMQNRPGGEEKRGAAPCYLFNPYCGRGDEELRGNENMMQNANGQEKRQRENLMQDANGQEKRQGANTMQYA